MFDHTKLRDAIHELLKPHTDDIAVFAFAVTFISKKGLEVYGTTIIPMKPRDHEDSILRDATAKKVCDAVTDLTKNVYGG